MKAKNRHMCMTTYCVDVEESTNQEFIRLNMTYCGRVYVVEFISPMLIIFILLCSCANSMN